MATWQAAKPGTVIGDDKGNYQIKVGGQWVPMPKGSLVGDAHGNYQYDSDAISTPPMTVTPTPESLNRDAPPSETANEKPPSTKEKIGKVADAVASNIPALPVLENALSGITGGVGSLVDALTGSPPGTHNFTYQPRTSVGKEIQRTVGGVANRVNEDVAQAGGHFVGLASNPANAEAATDTLRERLPEAAGAVGTVTGVGGALESTLAARAAAADAAATNYGLRTGADHPVSRNVAGESARPAVTAHNQEIANQTLGAQAGVKPGTPLTAANLEAARAAPDSVYTRAENAIPTGPLSPTAEQMVRDVGAEDLVVHSPDTELTVNRQKNALLSQPLTGSQVVNTQRALRYNGFRNAASEDPEQAALGSAQLRMADALHQHMVDTIPATADVTAEQLSAARVALAQNHTVDGILKGKDVDLQALARLHRNNPNMLSGPLRDFGDFANLHPEVSSLPSMGERFNPPGVATDIASIDLKNPVTWSQPFFGAAARRVLTGPTPRTAPKVTGLGGEFSPIDRTPQPPPGMTASPPTAPPAAPAAHPGDIPLADLLSHGVEQAPPEGLSLGVGASPRGGIPFVRDAAHEAGDLELAHDFPRAPVENNQDLGAVMSQGVPEGIVARTAQNPGLKMKVAHSPAFNNASGESAASMEAINRTAQEPPRFLIDPDGNVTPLKAEGAAVADYRPPKGSIVVQGGGPSGKPTIIDRGGLPESHANGLMARAFGRRKLGDEF